MMWIEYKLTVITIQIKRKMSARKVGCSLIIIAQLLEHSVDLGYPR